MFTVYVAPPIFFFFLKKRKKETVESIGIAKHELMDSFDGIHRQNKRVAMENLGKEIDDGIHRWK